MRICPGCERKEGSGHKSGCSYAFGRGGKKAVPAAPKDKMERGGKTVTKDVQK